MDDYKNYFPEPTEDDLEYWESENEWRMQLKARGLW